MRTAKVAEQLQQCLGGGVGTGESLLASTPPPQQQQPALIGPIPPRLDVRSAQSIQSRAGRPEPAGPGPPGSGKRQAGIKMQKHQPREAGQLHVNKQPVGGVKPSRPASQQPAGTARGSAQGWPVELAGLERRPGISDGWEIALRKGCWIGPYLHSG